MWIMDDSVDTRRLSLFQQFSNLPNYFHKKIQIREKEIVLGRHRPSSATEYLIRNKSGTTLPPQKKEKKYRRHAAEEKRTIHFICFQRYWKINML